MAEALETIIIPGIDLNPTRIALGTWAIGGWMWGGTNEAESIRTIRSAVDRGIKLIDTAPVYGCGRSEEIVGEALAEIGRHKVLMATKAQLAKGAEALNQHLQHNADLAKAASESAAKIQLSAMRMGVLLTLATLGMGLVIGTIGTIGFRGLKFALMFWTRTGALLGVADLGTPVLGATLVEGIFAWGVGWETMLDTVLAALPIAFSPCFWKSFLGLSMAMSRARPPVS